MKSKERDRRGRRHEKLSSRREETTPRTKESFDERKHRKLPESCTHHPPSPPQRTHSFSLNQGVFFFFFFFKVSGTLFYFIYLFIYLFLAVLGLRFCARAFSSCGKRGPLFIAVRGPITIAASLVAEHRLQTLRLSNSGSRA